MSRFHDRACNKCSTQLCDKRNKEKLHPSYIFLGMKCVQTIQESHDKTISVHIHTKGPHSTETKLCFFV